jgi:ubiquinone/menaquinone biosynthesis C-methylase UbiE
MPDFATIYARHAEEYDRLVSAEDYQGHLLRAIRRICPLYGLQVVELGAGTGRVTRLLAPWVRQIVACDRSAHMLAFAGARLPELLIDNVQLVLADNAALPVGDAVADLCLAGWSFGHATEWDAANWRMTIGAALAEMQRVLRPGGVAIVIETLGTGRASPEPPNAALADYYRWLEQVLGWRSTWIRTDYRFTTPQEADQLTGFFFGSPAQTRPAPHGRVTIAECTGIWWTLKAE